ncbi:hypothetical protein IJG27_03165 [Candidatus Saccharibacteria bacterium]|nr:hypothetical protein [Candidatus Saccharibacteria bacterium]MBQ6127367.1 hypothetical protein [Candidatus Saccharibacteria bacterium]
MEAKFWIASLNENVSHLCLRVNPSQIDSDKHYSCTYLFREAYHFIESGEDLNEVVSLNTPLLFPFTLVLAAGYVNNQGGETELTKEVGALWTGYAVNNRSSKSLAFKTTVLYPGNGGIRRDGFSVRYTVVLLSKNLASVIQDHKSGFHLMRTMSKYLTSQGTVISCAVRICEESSSG